VRFRKNAKTEVAAWGHNSSSGTVIAGVPPWVGGNVTLTGIDHVIGTETASGMYTPATSYTMNHVMNMANTTSPTS
jgi:hypothetical protein